MEPVFEWDPHKAATNRRKHRVSFEEAATAFADRLSVTVPDPDHSGARESRYILVGQSERGRLLAVSHAERGTTIRIISARRPPAASGNSMEKASSRAKAPARRAPKRSAVREELRAEYDFSGGVRGKYAGRFAPGRIVRVVVLAPDVADAFKSARAVNAALRRVLKERERTGGSGRGSRRTA
jgi:uncharacterized DUF497 family protein